MDTTSTIRASGVQIALTTVVLLALVVPAAPAAASATLEVCPAGCTYSSIQTAIDAATTGDTILVAPGTYVGALTLNKAVHLQATTFDQADPRRNSVIIDGNGASAVITIPSGLTAPPRLTGLVVRNGSSDGISPRSPFTAEACYFTGAGDLIDYERGSGGLLRGNVFEAAGDDAIDLDHPNVDLLIEANRISSSRQDGIEIRLQDDALARQATTTIRENEIRGNGQDGIQLIDYATDTNRRFVIERNLFTGNRSAAIGLMDNEQTSEDLRAASIREPIDVVNNTIVNNNAGISGGDNLVAVNNVITGSTLFGLKDVDGASRASHNLLFGNHPDLTGTNNVDAATTRYADPLLTSDFRLQPGSPAIDAGTADLSWNGRTVVSLSSADYSGLAPDLGWYESAGGTPVENRPPVVASVAIDPSSPRTNDRLAAVVEAHDADGDALVLSYQWLQNGTAIVGATGATLDLAVPGSGDRGDELAVLVTASDGKATSEPVISAAVTVVNSAPVFEQDLQDRTSREGDVVSLPASASDADGDPLTYAVTGTPPGLSIDAATGLISGTVAVAAAQGSPYLTSVTVTDGTASAPPDAFVWSVTTTTPIRGVVFRSVATTSARSATGITVPSPAGIRAGDVLVAAVSLRGTPNLTAPTGWTLVRVDTNGSTMRQAVYTRVVATTGEPSSYGWTFSTRTSSVAAAVLAYEGVDPLAPVDASNGQPNPTSSSITAPSLTSSAPDAMLVGVFGMASNATITEPEGMTERTEVLQSAGPDKLVLSSAEQLHASATATGPRTATTTPKTGVSIGQLLALRPCS
jgi:hypothetical protein